MEKLGYLATILLLTAVIVGPIGLSHAAPVDTAADAKAEHKKGLEASYADRDARFNAEKQRAADVKAKMEAMKKTAQKEIDAAIAARAQAIKQSDIPTTADLLAQIKAEAKATGNHFPNSGTNFRDGTSKSQVDLEQQRKSFDESIKAYKESIAKSSTKNIKSDVDSSRRVPTKQMQLTADEQAAKDKVAKEQAQKASEAHKARYGKTQ